MVNKMRMLLVLAMMLSSFSLSANEQPNVRTVTEQFRDWTLVCVEQEQRTVCEVQHAIVAPDGGVMGQVSLSNRTDNPEQLLFQIALPLLADLKRTVVIQVDENEPVQLQYAFCSPVACFVAEMATERLVEHFKKGSNFVIHSRNIQQGEIAMKGSLLGFSAAIGQLKKKIQP